MSCNKDIIDSREFCIYCGCYWKSHTVEPPKDATPKHVPAPSNASSHYVSPLFMNPPHEAPTTQYVNSSHNEKHSRSIKKKLKKYLLYAGLAVGGFLLLCILYQVLVILFYISIGVLLLYCKLM